MKVHIYKVVKNIYCDDTPGYCGDNFIIYDTDCGEPICACSREDIRNFENMSSISHYPELDDFYVIYKEDDHEERDLDLVFCFTDYPSKNIIDNPLNLKMVAGRIRCHKALSLLGIKINKEATEEKKDEPSDSPFDPVSRPSHYTKGRKHEPKDVIRDWGLNFNLGNAVKYISRAGRKDDILQDLEKAMTYIRFEMDAIREERSK